MSSDLKFFCRLFAAYFILVSFCLAYVCVKQKEAIVEKDIEILRLQQKISELKKVQKSSIKLVGELASEARK